MGFTISDFKFTVSNNQKSYIFLNPKINMENNYQDLSKLAQEVKHIFEEVSDGKVNPLIYVREIEKVMKNLTTPQQMFEFNRYLYQEAA